MSTNHRIEGCTFTPSLECRKVRALETIAEKINEPPMVFVPQSVS